MGSAGDAKQPGSTVKSTRPWSRAAAILIPAAALVAMLGWATFQKGGTPTPGDDAPPFTAARLDGDGSLSLSDFKGKPVVMNFWASWCGPCETEAPILNEAHRLYGREVAFLGVNIKDAKSKALAFERRFGVAYPSVRDDGGRIYADYGLTGQPETYLIDSEGTIVQHITGPITDKDGFLQSLDALVSENG